MGSRAVAGRLVAVVVCGVLAGLVLAAAVLPANLLLGMTVKATSDAWGRLPAELRTPAPAQRTAVYANDGTTLVTNFYDLNRTEVTLDEVAPVMRQAIVAAEDRRFYSHGGVDLRGVLRALVSNARDGTTQGASTLTMQYVRNVLKTDPDRTEEQRRSATEVSVGRKLQEMRYAAALEQTLDKDEILTRYLNIAYFGSGAYGIAAASERYFDTTPAELTLAQASLLAALVQSPDEYSPIDGDADAALARRSYVLDAMVRTGAITAGQADQARAEQLVLDPVAQPNGCTAVPGDHQDWGFFCDYLRSWWLTQPAFGDTVEQRRQALYRGGYRIVTSLDPAVQATALRQSLAVFDRDSPRALPIAAVEPGTGRVLALAVNRNYSLAANPAGQDNRPNTVNQLVAGGGATDGYQAGSTFKLFTMLAALEAGMPLATGYDAPHRLLTRYPAEQGPASCAGSWCPANADRSMAGHRTMWDGFGRSVNTYFVWLADQVGPAKVVEMAQRLGITFRADADRAFAEQKAADWGAFTLGVAATTPLDLANAYATVAAEGTYCAPLPVRSVAGPDGRALPVGDPSCRRVLDADVARAATDAARCPVGQQSAYGRCGGGGTATAAGRILDGRPVAGKSGTSDRDATKSFVAYTPQVAVAGIAANPDDPTDPMGISAQSGVTTAVARVVVAATAGQPELDFTPPSRDLAFGDVVERRPPPDGPSRRNLDLGSWLDWLDIPR